VKDCFSSLSVLFGSVVHVVHGSSLSLGSNSSSVYSNVSPATISTRYDGQVLCHFLHLYQVFQIKINLISCNVLHYRSACCVIRSASSYVVVKTQVLEPCSVSAHCAGDESVT